MKLNLKNKKDIDDKVLRTIIQYGLGFASRVKTLEEKCIDDWKSDKLYDKSSFVIYDGYIWKAKVTNQSSIWDEKYWNKIGDELSLVELDDIKAMLNLTDEQLKTLSSLILDSEIRLDKTWSSSKIYSDIQQCLSDSKAYTLQELAKKTGASYKIVTSTTDMTSTEFLYLLSNANNAYDIYALIDGTAQKIGDTTIDLSQFYTKTEIDNDFLKKTDADGKYATIPTVDKKVDKTSIVTTLDENTTDEQVPSAKVVNDNLNSKVDKFPPNFTSEVDIDNLINCGWYHANSSSGVKGVFPFKETWVNVFNIGFGSLNNNAYSSQIALSNSKNMYFRQRDNLDWNEWRRVCSTSTTDVNNVDINVLDSTNCSVKEYFRYSIKNGIAIIDFGGIQSSKTPSILLAEVPFISKNRALVNLTNANGNKVIGLVYINAITNKIYFNVGVPNEAGYGQMICVID